MALVLKHQDPALATAPPPDKSKFLIGLDGTPKLVDETGAVIEPFLSPAERAKLSGLPSTADPAGTAASVAASTVATHSGAVDPHGDRAWTDQRIASVIGAAPVALDTLAELATQLDNDQSAVAALTTTVSAKLAKSANLSDLTDATAARASLGLGTAATHAHTEYEASGAVTAHAGAADPHPVYLTVAEAGGAYEVAGTSAAAMSAHSGAADPHAQYLTATEGNAAYDLVGTAAAAVVAHVSAGDPHAGYLTQTEGDGRYVQPAQLPAVPPSLRLAANKTTTVVAAGNTNLAFAVLANDIYEFEFALTAQCSGIGGQKFAITVPVGSTLEATIIGTGASLTAHTASRLTASGALSTQNYGNVANVPAPVWIKGTVLVGATPGSVTLQHASVTAAQTSTIFAGSALHTRKASNV